MRDFFISYNSIDQKWATWIAWILEGVGYTVYVQAWDILPGDNFVAEMQEAMTKTRKTVAVLTERYFESKYAKREWTAAIARDPEGTEGRLVPIKVEPCKTEGFFSTIVYVNIIGLSEQDARTTILGAFSSRENPNRIRPKQQPIYPPRDTAAFPGATGRAVINITDKLIAGSSTDLLTAPLRAHLMRLNDSPLTPEERMKLHKSLNRLSLGQFNIMVYALNPPSGAIPELPAPQTERTQALLTWADSKTGRGLREVQRVLQEMLLPEETPTLDPKDSDCGTDVVKTCNRRKQEEDFNTLYELCNNQRAGQTQFYVIHGAEMEAHASLVDRFCATTLLTKMGGAKPNPWTLGWPQTGHARIDADRMVSLLFEQSGKDDRPGTLVERAGAFRKIAASLPNVVVVHHRIGTKDWTRTTRRLLRAYLEFWDHVKRDDDGTLSQFVVFLSIVYRYPAGGARGLKKQWSRLLNRMKIAQIKFDLWLLSKARGRSPLASSAQAIASFHVLKELACVGIEDVTEWMDKHRYGEFEAQHVRQSQNIFAKRKWEIFDCVRMADMEEALLEFVNSMKKRREPIHE